MPFKNKYLKYALMDEAADIEDERLRAIAEDIAARAARERRIARSVKQPTIKSPPVPPQAAPPNIAVLGKDRDITMYPTGTAAKHVSTRSLERMEAINDSIWRIDAWLKEWRDAAKKYLSYDKQTQESVPDLLAELVWPNSAVVENLGSAEDLKLLAKLRKIAASKYPGMHMEGAKQLKGFTRLVLVNKEISGNPAEWPNELLDKFNDPDAVGLEDIREMAVIMAWLEKVLPSMVRQNNATRELYRRIVSRNDDLIPFNRPDKLAWTKTGDYNDLAEHLVGERLSGSGFASKLYQTAANAYRKKNCLGARMLEDGEFHPLCANWMGPGTDIVKAMKYPSANAADECARTHDLLYFYASKAKDPERRANLIREADEKIISCLKKTNDTPYTQLGLAGIATKMTAEDLIPTLTKALMGKETASSYFGSKKGGCLGCHGACGYMPSFGTFSTGLNRIM